MQQVTLTLAEACGLLAPPVSERALRDIIRALRIRPAGRRYHGRKGRPADLFAWDEIIRLHAAIRPWLDSACEFHQECG